MEQEFSTNPTWLYALGSMHLSPCTRLYALGSMRAALCARLYAPGSICTWLFALGFMHLALCTALCTWLHALGSMYLTMQVGPRAPHGRALRDARGFVFFWVSHSSLSFDVQASHGMALWEIAKYREVVHLDPAHRAMPRAASIPPAVEPAVIRRELLAHGDSVFPVNRLSERL